MTSLPLAAGCPWLRSASRLRQVAHWAKWFTNATEAAESKAVKTHNQAVENLVATGFTPPEVEIGRSRNWPKSKLAEVEQWFLLCFFFLSFLFFLLLCFFTSVLFSCSYSSPLLFVFCSVSVFVRKNHSKRAKMDSKREKEDRNLWREEGNKSAKFWGPPPFGAPPFGNNKKLAEVDIGQSRWPKAITPRQTKPVAQRRSRPPKSVLGRKALRRTPVNKVKHTARELTRAHHTGTRRPLHERGGPSPSAPCGRLSSRSEEATALAEAHATHAA